MTFNPGAPSAATSTLVASPGIGDGGRRVHHHADGDGRGCPRQSRSERGGDAVGQRLGNSFGTISGTTNAQGVFTTTLASTTAQAETITATEGSVHETTSVTFYSKVIEAFGSTSLVQVGNNFYLDSISTGSGPELKYAGAGLWPASPGMLTPIGAEQTSTAMRWPGRSPAPISNRLEYRQQWQLRLAISGPRGVGNQLNPGIAETSFHQDLEWRWRDRPSHDGDRGDSDRPVWFRLALILPRQHQHRVWP